MGQIYRQRMAAAVEGDFVVFLVGLRINRLWKVHKWLPVMAAMGRMLRDLAGRPDSGLLGYRLQPGVREHMVVQYWRSFEHLERFARDPGRDHVAAWASFNRAVGSSGDVGIWHETYRVAAGQYEAVYHNMPAYGLGAAGRLVSAAEGYATAAGRLGLRDEDSAPVSEAGDVRG